MMLDDWYDWWRLALLLIAAICLTTLVVGRNRFRHTWSEARRDLWFALLMWTLASGAMQLESLIRDSPMRFRLVLVTAASIVTLKILTSNRDNEEDNPNLQ